MNFPLYLSFSKQNANLELDPTLKGIHKADDWRKGTRELAGFQDPTPK